ncbi:hypothetical protein FSPOR_9031 [Fusarium sporotrichioides]|uniref:Uncharacterized protein n=1 Tax=Fusarium sporotrichioides TaxID=5514 RepID=A0A395RSJ7_FUSSP|nr:hypothetical protein FSPOR_9031 [Fusarium sporotrichioides]
MKIATIALFLLSAVAAVPADKAADKPAEMATTANNKASCSISCSLWYKKCYYRPWAYTCDDRGNFRRRGWNPDCDANCWCKCDAKV